MDNVFTVSTFQNLQGFLLWLTGSSGGAFIVVSFLASWGFEKFTFWQKASSEVKALTIFIIAGVVGALSVVIARDPELVAMIDPYFRPIMYTAIAWLTTQAAHGGNPLRKKTE